MTGKSRKPRKNKGLVGRHRRRGALPFPGGAPKDTANNEQYLARIVAQADHPSAWRRKVAFLRRHLREVARDRHSFIEQNAELQSYLEDSWARCEAEERRTKSWKEVAKLAQDENRRLLTRLEQCPGVVEAASATVREHAQLVKQELDELQSRWQRTEDQRFAAVEQCECLEGRNQILAKKVDELAQKLAEQDQTPADFSEELARIRKSNEALALDVEAKFEEIGELRERLERVRRSNEVLALDLELQTVEACEQRNSANAKLEGLLKQMSKDDERFLLETRHLDGCFRRAMRIMQNRIDRYEADLTLAEEEAFYNDNRAIGAENLAKEARLCARAVLDGARVAFESLGATVDTIPEPEPTEPMHEVTERLFVTVHCATCGRPPAGDEGFIRGADDQYRCFGCDQAEQDGCEDLPSSASAPAVKSDADSARELCRAVGRAVARRGSAYGRGGALFSETLTAGANLTESLGKTSLSKRFGRVVPKDVLADGYCQTSSKDAVTEAPEKSSCQNSAIRASDQIPEPLNSDPERLDSSGLDTTLDRISTALGLDRTQAQTLRRLVGGDK